MIFVMGFVATRPPATRIALAALKLAIENFLAVLTGLVVIPPMIGMQKAQLSILKAVSQELIDEKFIFPSQQSKLSVWVGVGSYSSSNWVVGNFKTYPE